ncbi:flagellar biosynthetic protein FliO [Lysobacter xanthus]
MDAEPVALAQGTNAPVATAPAVVEAPAAATPATAAPAVAQAPAATAPVATKPAATARSITFPVRPATSAQVASPVAHAPAADAGSIGGAVFSLLLVIGLILGLGWLAKRMPGMQRGAGTSQLKIVASVALGPRDRAVVLDVGGQQLLVGVGQGGVRTLHTLEHPLPVVESTAPSPFAQVLAQHFGRKS